MNKKSILFASIMSLFFGSSFSMESPGDMLFPDNIYEILLFIPTKEICANKLYCVDARFEEASYCVFFERHRASGKKHSVVLKDGQENDLDFLRFLHLAYKRKKTKVVPLITCEGRQGKGKRLIGTFFVPFLSQLGALKSLSLARTNVTDDMCKKMISRSVEKLDLSFCRGVTEKGLFGVESLREVNLRGTSVRDGICHVLKSCKNCVVLDLSGTEVFGLFFCHLPKSLRELNLSGCKRLSANDIKFRGGWPKGLTHLNLEESSVTDALLKFKALANLKVLNLSKCEKIKGKACPEWPESLEEVYLSGAWVKNPYINCLPRSVRILHAIDCTSLDDSFTFGGTSVFYFQGNKEKEAKKERFIFRWPASLEKLLLDGALIVGHCLTNLPTYLIELSVARCSKLDEKFLEKLPGKGLSTIILDETPIQGFCLNSLPRSVEKLSMARCGSLNDKAINYVKKLSNVTEFTLTDNEEICGAILKILGDEVKALRLDGCKNLQEEFLLFPESLRILSLARTRTTGSALGRQLSAMVHLEEINLSDCKNFKLDNIRCYWPESLKRADFSRMSAWSRIMSLLPDGIKELKVVGMWEEFSGFPWPDGLEKVWVSKALADKKDAKELADFGVEVTFV